MSTRDFGGKVAVRFSTGEVISLRATYNINPARVTVEPVTNQDGSVDRNSTNVPARAEISFADRGLNLDKLMRSDRFNITIDEDNNGVTHYFTRAFLVGDPQINRVTGEVTGMSIAAEAYSRKD
jgi:hypothetical protein